jgi:hypothetical protein
MASLVATFLRIPIPRWLERAWQGGATQPDVPLPAPDPDAETMPLPLQGWLDRRR